VRLVGYGAVMAGTLGMLAWQRASGSDEQAVAVAFTTFVLFQVFNAFNARDEQRSVFHRDSLRNARLWIALAAVVVLQVLAVHIDPVKVVLATPTSPERLAGRHGGGVEHPVAR
jgi:P-type Ca2+ transporter type 2C